MTPLLRRLLPTLALLLAAVSVHAQAIGPEQKQKMLDSLQRTVERRAFVPGIDFAQWPEFLARHRAEIDAAADVNAFTGAVNQALREFGISHIRLLSPAAARTRATGQTIGYGLVTGPDPRGLVVDSVAPESPAERLGIQAGDIVVAVEGIERPRTVASVLPDGTERDTCAVTILRPSTGATRLCMLLKKPFSTVRLPTLTWASPDVAVLKLWSFTRGYERRQIEELMRGASKARALVLDLRGNGGGLVANLNHLLGLLAPEGTPTGTSVNRPMTERFAAETGGDPKDMIAVARWNGPTMRTRKGAVEPFAGPIAVLIDRRSGSASEIVSAVLREKRGAVLVGRQSAGAVLVSQFARLDDGFEVQLPLSDYVTPGGMRLEKNGLKPDVEVAEARRGEPDAVLAAAVKALAPVKGKR